MKYVACIRNAQDNSIEILPVGTTPDDEDPRYDGQDVHIVPCPTGQFVMGVHDMSRDCACHTKVETKYHRVLVIHNHLVN